jgi:uncharacterized protein
MQFFSRNPLMMVFFGVSIGLASGFSGLGGGFLVVPLLLYLGFEARKAVGTSFVVVLLIALSALFAHRRLDNIEYFPGALLAVGGIIGAQAGARLVNYVSSKHFQYIFAALLAGLIGHLLIFRG